MEANAPASPPMSDMSHGLCGSPVVSVGVESKEVLVIAITATDVGGILSRVVMSEVCAESTLLQKKRR